MSSNIWFAVKYKGSVTVLEIFEKMDVIAHDFDLETLLPGNLLLKNISKDWAGITHKCFVCF